MTPKRIFRALCARPILALRFGTGNKNWDVVQRVAVFPRLGLAYNRIKKNANTTTVILLREMECGEVEERGEAKDNSLTLRTAPIGSLLGLKKTDFFVVVRNPYSRVLSAFLDKFRYENYRRNHGDFDLTAAGFRQFLVWLKAGGLDKDGHWNLQTGQLFLPLAKYDAVVRFENFQAEMEALLHRHGLTPPAGRLGRLYPSDAGKQTSADKRMAEFYTPESIALVAEIYRRDFEALGYSTEFPV